MTLFANPLNVVEGQFAMMPFSLTDSDNNTNPSLYSVSINWGDGSSPTTTTLSWTGSNFQPMTSGHTFTKEGSYAVGVTVTDSDGDQAFLQETANVADAALSQSSGDFNPSATAGQLFTLPVGFFSDANSGALPGDFTASINWGDGSGASTATISSSGGGFGGASFQVNGTHDYAASATYNYTLNIHDSGGGSLTEQGTFTAAGSQDQSPLVPMPPPPPSWVNGPAFHWSEPAAPIIGGVASQINAEGDSVSLQVNASDPNPPFNLLTPLLTYDAVGLPAGLSINHRSGLISGTINYGAADVFGGQYSPTIVVADTLGASAFQV